MKSYNNNNKQPTTFWDFDQILKMALTEIVTETWNWLCRKIEIHEFNWEQAILMEITTENVNYTTYDLIKLNLI